MPEGDSLHRVARLLRPDLEGKVLEGAFTRERGELAHLVGRPVTKVEAIGKHLLIHIDREWAVRVHLGMKGRVRRYRRADPQPRMPTLRLDTAQLSFVCVRAYQAELIHRSRLRAHPKLRRLGPDLLGENIDVGAVLARARLHGHRDRSIADLLLDQRVAAGIGNVYKSELLFLARVAPETLVRDVPDERLGTIYRDARRLLQYNLDTIERTTVPEERRPRPDSPRLFVYGRAGDPCLDCHTTIRCFLQGDLARPTYFCRSCQASPR
ncbi:MAG: DNA-formamidopyrimidine glycosylase family protein [Myxococcota bacterium]